MNPQPKKLGLYGGTFDPIHNGHLILARDARELFQLDYVVFILAKISPHKLGRPPATAEHRRQLVHSALEGEEGFQFDDSELHRAGPSFTIDTVRAYRERFPDTQLYYFIGDDNVDELDTWKEIEELKQLVQFVILSRAGTPFFLSYPMVTRRVEISSTEIRNRIARGQSVRYMVPHSTCTLIEQLGIYRND